MEGPLCHNARVALYARVSTEEQREGHTIDSQVAELEQFAAAQGWLVVGVYKDAGWSGALLARPELDRLRDDAPKGLFSAVLINDVDRLARDVSHLGIIKRDLERAGVKVIFRKLPGDSSPTHNLMVNVLGSFAEFERELIADRTRRGRRHKVEARQQFIGCQPPYGYRYIRKDTAAGTAGTLMVNLEEAAVVRQMFEWIDAEGLSAHAVVRRLNAQRVPPRRGRRWHTSSVLRILHNETYAGTWHYNKLECRLPLNATARDRYARERKTSRRTRPKTEWLPVRLPENLRIVDADRWQRVQRRLKQNIALSRRNTKHEYLLRGLVRCGTCGARYVGQPQHGKFYYRCNARCRQPAVREDLLDREVWTAVERAIQDPSLVSSQAAHLRDTQRRRSDADAEQRASVEAAIQQILSEETRVLEAYRRNILSVEQLERELRAIRARLTPLQKERDTLLVAPDAPPVTFDVSTEELCRLVRARAATLSFEERQRLLRLLITEILFYGDRVLIRGLIPCRSTGCDHPGRTPNGGSSCPTGQACPRDFVPTQIRSHGHNVAASLTSADSGDFVPPRLAPAVRFEVVRAVPRLHHSRPFTLEQRFAAPDISWAA
jgi:site-specific DNA recombinase